MALSSALDAVSCAVSEEHFVLLVSTILVLNLGRERAGINWKGTYPAINISAKKWTYGYVNLRLLMK